MFRAASSSFSTAGTAATTTGRRRQHKQQQHHYDDNIDGSRRHQHQQPKRSSSLLKSSTIRNYYENRGLAGAGAASNYRGGGDDVAAAALRPPPALSPAAPASVPSPDDDDDDEGERRRVPAAGASRNDASDNADASASANAAVVRVVAPATLEEGYTFDVLVRGRPLTVTVPVGGVRKGEEFEIRLLPDDATTDRYDDTEDAKKKKKKKKGMYDDGGNFYGYGCGNKDGDYDDEDEERTVPIHASSSSGDLRQGRRGDGGRRDSSGDYYDDEEDGGYGSDSDSEDGGIVGRAAMTVAPQGRWRHGLCSCCDVVTQGTFWMGFLCTPVLIAQLLTRLRLNWKGRKDDRDDEEEVSLSFNRIVLSAIAVLLMGYIPVVGAVAVLLYLLVVVVYVGKNVRYEMRNRYKIPPTTTSFAPAALGGSTSSSLDDCLSMFFCGCCSAIQMARQTHNDKDYPGYCCTTTGLEPKAPPV